MAYHFLPILTSLLIISVLPFIAGWFLKRSNKRRWKHPFISWASWLWTLGGITFALIWLIGRTIGPFDMQRIGMTGAALTSIASAFLLITLPITHLLNTLWKRINITSPGVDPGKRKFLRLGVAAFPGVALGASTAGFANSHQSVRIPRLSVYYPDLAPELDGFKIAHLSDLHLGYFFNLDDLEKVLHDLKAEKPDMVAVTGDIADDLSQLPEALEMMASLAPGFTSIGNHEYYRGSEKAVEILSTSPLPFLRDSGQLFSHNGRQIFVGGADDPRILKHNIDHFMKETITKALKDAPQDIFTLLLSHRPRALNMASMLNVDLVLAGHTHGGQIGFQGKPVLETLGQEPYSWGHYRMADTHLYTTSGMGHWFPFRIGCPTEAPIIELCRGEPKIPAV